MKIMELKGSFEAERDMIVTAREIVPGEQASAREVGVGWGKRCATAVKPGHVVKQEL